MEVMIQSSNMETFNFNSGTMSSPFLSPPSSPKRFGEYYLSAPTSPSRLSELYSEIDYLSSIEVQHEDFTESQDETLLSSLIINNKVDDKEESGFAFLVNQTDKSSRSAEELFHGGKIKPLTNEETKVVKQQNNRGRDRERTESTTSSNNSGRRVTRSLSPYRKSNYTWESLEEQNSKLQQQPRSNIKEETKSNNSKGSRRWKLSDLLLFRSASEGRGSSKDPLKKYFVGKKSEEVKGSSFRSSETFSNNGSKKKGQVSAHEMHYAMKKAESQDMKKRTFLPYRQGILGRLSGFGL
ncbi:uncharacterized protein [Cicer arietinum]|uniref:Uncharacterized protein LOC101491878 n=1 Tax=Cicer arietinum TaxID=3827 RepID=A0A1S2Y5F0_CICAR|nr:uncharacterized protein LOC101491878 [Cicer arietinum]